MWKNGARSIDFLSGNLRDRSLSSSVKVFSVDELTFWKLVFVCDVEAFVSVGTFRANVLADATSQPKLLHK